MHSLEGTAHIRCGFLEVSDRCRTYESVDSSKPSGGRFRSTLASPPRVPGTWNAGAVRRSGRLSLSVSLIISKLLSSCSGVITRCPQGRLSEVPSAVALSSCPDGSIRSPTSGIPDGSGSLAASSALYTGWNLRTQNWDTCGWVHSCVWILWLVPSGLITAPSTEDPTPQDWLDPSDVIV